MSTPASAVAPGLRTTLIGFERLKHPSKSFALAPIVAPINPSSKDKCHTKHVPAPAPSKSIPFTASNVPGNPRILPLESVTTNVLLAPMISPDTIIVLSVR